MSLKTKAFSGVIWTTIQQFSVQIINFVVQIILARLLLPEMFGLIAMIQIFIVIGQTLMDGGMTSSLIRTSNADQGDYSTVFFTNVFISLCVYIAVFLSAPSIARFYGEPVLENLIKVFSIIFVIRSFVAVQTTKLTKEMNFKLQMMMQIPSTIVGGMVGIYMAVNGYGVWSLVLLNLVQALLFTIQHWFFSKWKPALVFDYAKLKTHFSFGIKLTLSSFLDTLYNNSYTIVIEKTFSPALVGYYTQAETLRLFPVNQLSTALGKVTYPLFSTIQNDDVKLKSIYKKLMEVVLLIVIPIMAILLGVAEPLFTFVLGEKWLPAVPIFQILCLASIVRPVSTYNLNILKVKGRTDLFLRIEVFKKAIGVMTLLCSLQYGLITMVWGLSITSILFLFVNGFYSGRLINYSVYQQIKDVTPLFLFSLVSFTIMVTLGKLYVVMVTWMQIVLGIVTFMIPYCIFCWMFRRALIFEVLTLLKHKNV